MRAVNLLPRDDSSKRKNAHLPALIAAPGVVFVVGVLMLMSMSASSSVSSKQNELRVLQDELGAVPPPAPANNAGAQLADQKKQRIVALSTALSRRVDWDRVMRELSLVLPEDVWLQSLTAKSPVGATSAAGSAPAPNGTPRGLTISGYTYSQDGVARLLSRLQVVPDLKNVQLQQSALAPIGRQTVVEFTIAADLRQSGGPTS